MLRRNVSLTSQTSDSNNSETDEETHHTILSSLGTKSNTHLHSKSNLNRINHDEMELLKTILAKRKQIYELELKKIHLEREHTRKSMMMTNEEDGTNFLNSSPNLSSAHSHAFDEDTSPFLKYPSSILLTLLQQQQVKSSPTRLLTTSNHDERNKNESQSEVNSIKNNDITMLTETNVPKHCVPIRTDVRNMDWKALASVTQFDVILMDPPWQLATSNPLRGVAIGYKPLSDKHIQNMDINSLQEKKGGFLFIWVINAKYTKTLEMIEQWGYKYVDEITWVKRTIHRRLAKGHGYYLQHAKENCIIAMKCKSKEKEKEMLETARNRVAKLSDVIFSDRRGQSQKPEALYHFIEQMVPDGKYLEIFGRRNNLRDYWVTIGNEL
ncbi:hypothetical protein FDP41_010961 [Naegleria fowleri]|uniref:mRNA m(6)A methyltransferase n=1 Tax=Naegleria fowleri TaxID=5763 RepID=A0A6A5BXZ2_NAEFO|nr:uncharacterized protein FDP41_010961 [Naegleria fowleri]KAF0982983.1 hypothetical protein FDP41_010961 [Naegleria fowleri]CAG4713754.1 unnamed protein product [Naegleria fowleri]